jgi:hypothetical protein
VLRMTGHARTDDRGVLSGLWHCSGAPGACGPLCWHAYPLPSLSVTVGSSSSSSRRHRE